MKHKNGLFLSVCFHCHQPAETSVEGCVSNQLDVGCCSVRAKKLWNMELAELERIICLMATDASQRADLASSHGAPWRMLFSIEVLSFRLGATHLDLVGNPSASSPQPSLPL